MTKIALTLSLIVANFCFSQNSSSMFKRTNFNTWESEISSSISERYYELLTLSDFHRENKEFYDEGYLDSHFTVTDFDKDGLNDIIYEGYLKSNGSECVVFLHRTEDEFSQVFQVAGYPIEISSPDAPHGMQISIKHYGCCEDVISNIEHYSLVNIDNQLSFKLTAKYSFVDVETAVFPTVFLDKPIQFETINSKYTLRFTPEIDDSTVFTSYMIGNETAIYPEGSIGVALAEKTDDTGRVWWFVYMKNNLGLLENWLHSGFNNEAHYYSYGWISSRYVSIIN